MRRMSAGASFVKAKPARLLGLHTTLETCGSISSEASFSSSLKFYLFLVYSFTFNSTSGFETTIVYQKHPPCGPVFYVILRDGRICVFHPCALGLETTRTTGKNNFEDIMGTILFQASPDLRRGIVL